MSGSDDSHSYASRRAPTHGEAGARVAALFVDRRGPYWNREDIDAWDIERDARKYDGPWPVVAHPPCQLWVNLAAVNWKRYQRERPAWYEGGDDGSCFKSALRSVARWGGVLEHPAGSHAWPAHDLNPPTLGGWMASFPGWVTEVWQSAYGHKARKRTWLLYVGESPPPPLNWSARPGTHQVGWFDREKPTLTKAEAIHSPPAFAELLISLARMSRGQERAA